MTSLRWEAFPDHETQQSAHVYFGKISCGGITPVWDKDTGKIRMFRAWILVSPHKNEWLGTFQKHGQAVTAVYNAVKAALPDGAVP